MKKLMSMALAALFATMPCFAQNIERTRVKTERPANEMSVGYGFVSVPDIALGFAGIFGTALTGGLARVHDISSTGTAALEYDRFLGRHVAVGGMVTLEHASITFDQYDGKDENGNNKYSPGSPQGTVFLSVMPVVKLPWFYKEHVSMYSKAGAGLATSFGGDKSSSSSDEASDKDSNISFALQASLVGIDFGSVKYRGFVELGFGMQGLVSFGFRYSL